MVTKVTLKMKQTTRKLKKNERPTRVWQKWRFSAPQTVLWLIKLWFSASTFVVKIATFAKLQTVSRNYKTDHENNFNFSSADTLLL